MAMINAILLLALSSYVGWASAKLAKDPVPPPIPHKVLNSTYMKDYSEVVVIGDVHGNADQLIELVKKIDKDAKGPGKVLKILTGDVVNKGPNSILVLHYLMTRDDVLSVRGNHDDYTIDQYFNVIHKDKKEKKNKKKWKKEKKTEEGLVHMKEGEKWMTMLGDDEAQYMVSMPYTIQIPSLNAVFVHGGILPGKPLDEASLATGDLKKNSRVTLTTMRNIVRKDGELEARELREEGEAWAKVYTEETKKQPEEKRIHVYFGHDAGRGLQNTEDYATGVDTKCVKGKKLTGLFIHGDRKGEMMSVKCPKSV